MRPRLRYLVWQHAAEGFHIAKVVLGRPAHPLKFYAGDLVGRPPYNCMLICVLFFQAEWAFKRMTIVIRH